MKFDEALHRLIDALIAEYGIENPVTEICVSHEAFNRIMYDLYQKRRYGINYSDISDCKVLGVHFRAKEMEK